MSLIPQLNNQGNWTLFYSESFQRAETVTGAKVPIPVVTVPILSDEHLIAVQVGSSTVPSGYYLGGYISFWAEIQLGSPSAQRAKIGASLEIQFGVITLVRCPKLSEDYEIRIAVPPYFQDVTYEIHEYTGLGEPTIEGKLDSVYAQVI